MGLRYMIGLLRAIFGYKVSYASFNFGYIGEHFGSFFFRYIGQQYYPHPVHPDNSDSR